MYIYYDACFGLALRLNRVAANRISGHDELTCPKGGDTRARRVKSRALEAREWEEQVCKLD